jgi:ABC-type multidrug transport system permease subunit
MFLELFLFLKFSLSGVVSPFETVPIFRAVSETVPIIRTAAIFVMFLVLFSRFFCSYFVAASVSQAISVFRACYLCGVVDFFEVFLFLEQFDFFGFILFLFFESDYVS